jgi:hypothetical protein
MKKSNARERSSLSSIVTTRKVRKYANERNDQAGNAYVKPDVTSYDYYIYVLL